MGVVVVGASVVGGSHRLLSQETRVEGESKMKGFRSN